MLEFIVNGQELTRIDKTEPATDAQKYPKIRFTFDGTDWNGKAKTAYFRAGDTVYPVLLDGSGECLVPYESIVRSESRYARTQGSFMHVSLVGVQGTVRITTNEVPVKLNTSGYGDMEQPGTPTETVYEQILTAYAESQSNYEKTRSDYNDMRQEVDKHGGIFANAEFPHELLQQRHGECRSSDA